jgi:hypothetical protein
LTIWLTTETGVHVFVSQHFWTKRFEKKFFWKEIRLVYFQEFSNIFCSVKITGFFQPTRFIDPLTGWRFAHSAQELLVTLRGKVYMYLLIFKAFSDSDMSHCLFDYLNKTYVTCQNFPLIYFWVISLFILRYHSLHYTHSNYR